jgi:hypothetical protein
MEGRVCPREREKSRGRERERERETELTCTLDRALHRGNTIDSGVIEVTFKGVSADRVVFLHETLLRT